MKTELAIIVRLSSLMNICCMFCHLEPPKEDGGAEVTKYVVELSEGLSGKLQIRIINKLFLS